ncbi:N-Dimethylarginine dimethylaminohydrolase [Nocardia amikacinitolerans]|uniref:dimethylargininase n=1 Tax=Nocardia amikacinitolerans TaxID=756689 RepID=UPI00082AB7F5|nr:dimethylargininase [Nocardia amikacinitolerans]MCP2321398.1 N-Dimethylarginine dimethylaminohydrolase [Nocardia amikacinitolerans]
MTSVATLQTSEPTPARRPVPRRFVMCRPDHFDVRYSINPWMNPDTPVNRELALAQWDDLRATFERYGHRVDVVPGEPGLPDMVFAANGGLAVGDRILSARFTHAERTAEGPAFHRWFAGRGVEVAAAAEFNEGEGDFALIGGRFLAGTGFRSSAAAHREVELYFGIPVVSLELVDPRFYHLDTVLMVLDDTTIAYYPPAFAETSRAVLAALFPDAVEATDADAAVLGLNGVSDGYHVFLSPQATDLAAALRARGYLPVPVDVSEMLKAGGGIKCCTLELH